MAWLERRTVPFEGAQRLPSPKIALFTKRAFLTAEECAGLVARIEAGCRPSTLTDDLSGDSGFRTSSSCDLAPDPLVGIIDARVAAFLGVDPASAEPMQGQRYLVGQEFKPHTDYFEPSGLDYWEHVGRSGQRTWTAMIYLNEPAAGGATRFKTIDKTIQPETGKLLAWNNRLPDGGVNGATLHHGMKVRAGTKYIVTKWFRERPWPHG
ncbi:MAG: 2OG-Fe(II) oxygenase [Parafilimonas terrae]|nr:2OG-Fe(II) oxygenase [Parafilimonas terrae]